MASESEEIDTDHVVVSEIAVNVNDEEEDENNESELVTVVEFNEGLIYLIQQRPVLWDNRVRGYSDRAAKLTAWEEISQIVQRDVDHVHRKWLSLRDRYARELKKMRNLENQGLSHCVAKQWNYFNLLSFLKDVVKPRSSKPVEKRSYVPIVYKEKSKSITNLDDISWKDAGLINSSPEQLNIKSKSPTLNFMETDLTDLKPSISLKRKFQNLDEESQQVGRDSNLPLDPDEAFCTSLIHYFKALNPQKKIRAQIDILQVLQGNM